MVMQNLFALMIVIIVLVVAVIPTVQEAITDGNQTGTIATILDLIPLLLAILGLTLVAKEMGFA